MSWLPVIQCYCVLWQQFYIYLDDSFFERGNKPLPESVLIVFIGYSIVGDIVPIDPSHKSQNASDKIPQCTIL